MKHMLLSLNGAEEMDPLGYTIFEENQVLTAEQLNGVAQYLEEEDRRTRVGLLGVGIACGLRVSLGTESRVLLSRGVAVTTAGYLLCIPADVTYATFRPYPEGAPRYEPFHRAGERIRLFELVAEGTEETGASPLSQFGPLRGMVALLLVETSDQDKDLCSSTGCDNLGKKRVYVPRLLLTDRTSAVGLDRRLDPIDPAALPDVVAERPVIATVGGLPALARIYRDSCTKILAALKPALAAPALSSLLPPSAASWAQKLDAIHSQFASREAGIQYYYDLLKDLVETYNALRDLLLGTDTVCCPDVDAFPRHLLLGSVSAEPPRTGFYPSPFVDSSGALEHARFLAWKLGSLIEGFKLPEGSGVTVRITPSPFEDRSLEDRAIPYYYDAPAVHTRWSYELARRGLSDRCYSYHAAAYGAKGGAANPLGTQAGRFSFYRIEGYLNRPVAEVKQSLENEIKGKNLPFAVRAVLLSGDRTKIVDRPPASYSDLHRFHRVLRQDVAYQLDDVVTFGTSLKGKVVAAVDGGVDNSINSTTLAKGIAEENSRILSDKAPLASTTLNLSYEKYQADATWKDNLNAVRTASGNYKSGLGSIIRTDYQTPLDTLIASTHVNWLPWLDQIIQEKEDRRVDRLLFNNFLAEHPGLEHFAGVPRGGTLVLVYSAAGQVVADFALPYLCCETVEKPPAEEPTLTRPDLPFNWSVANAVAVEPSADQRFNWFETTRLEPRFDKFYTVFERSANMIGNVYSNVSPPPTTDGDLEDILLKMLVREVVLNIKKLLLWLKNLGRDNEEMRLDRRRTAEQDVLRAIDNATQYITKSGINVEPGGEGYRALTLISESFADVTDRDVLASLRDGIKVTNRPIRELRGMLDRIVKGL